MKSICYRTNLKLANKILDRLDRPSAVIVVMAVSMSKPKESMSIDSSLVDVRTDRCFTFCFYSQRAFREYSPK